MSEEQIALRFNGGPLDADSRFVEGLPWPPPDRLALKHINETWAIADAAELDEEAISSTDGIYYLEDYSKLPERPESKHVIRGATYTFNEKEN